MLAASAGRPFRRRDARPACRRPGGARGVGAGPSATRCRRDVHRVRPGLPSTETERLGSVTMPEPDGLSLGTAHAAVRTIARSAPVVGYRGDRGDPRERRRNGDVRRDRVSCGSGPRQSLTSSEVAGELTEQRLLDPRPRRDPGADRRARVHDDGKATVAQVDQRPAPVAERGRAEVVARGRAVVDRTADRTLLQIQQRAPRPLVRDRQIAAVAEPVLAGVDEPSVRERGAVDGPGECRRRAREEVAVVVGAGAGRGAGCRPGRPTRVGRDRRRRRSRRVGGFGRGGVGRLGRLEARRRCRAGVAPGPAVPDDEAAGVGGGVAEPGSGTQATSTIARIVKARSRRITRRG